MRMNKLFDEKGRLLGKFSIVDILAILMVLVLVAAVFWRFSRTERYVDMGPVETGVEYTYQVKVSGVRSFTADAIRVGDEMYSDSNKILGTVKAIEVSDAYEIGENADGELLLVPSPERVDVLVTLTTRGEIRGGRYFTDGIEISKSNHMGIHSKYVVTSGIVWSIG